jgi:hypothetical protein
MSGKKNQLSKIFAGDIEEELILMLPELKIKRSYRFWVFHQ